MNPLIRTVFSLILCSLLLPYQGISQDTDQSETKKPDLEKIAREIIHSRGTCALITLDKEGRPRVRMMDPFTPEEDFTIWFGTNPKSRKVVQLKNDERITLHFAAEDQSGYVSIYGKAQLVDDADSKEKYWKKKWEDFYPNYPEGYMLIKVTPEWMEVVSIPDGVVGNTVTWQPDAIEFEKK